MYDYYLYMLLTTSYLKYICKKNVLPLSGKKKADYIDALLAQLEKVTLEGINSADRSGIQSGSIEEEEMNEDIDEEDEYGVEEENPDKDEEDSSEEVYDTQYLYLYFLFFLLCIFSFLIKF